MGLFSTNSTFPWISLTTEKQLNEFLSLENPILIFKHSTRCSISSMVLRNFEKEYEANSTVSLLFLDLIAFRDLSTKIADLTQVIHQSPQVIVLKNKEVLYHASHEQISAEKIKSILS